ncbi:MAG: transporter substrate-binding domain-containing protein [Coriobacteriales bacterium]|jgi:ABC-type amino acid transport substrate-binding protein|nr:transporter substrate-binding domain-containing protein [Coriobacteriales bacterium]
MKARKFIAVVVAGLLSLPLILTGCGGSGATTEGDKYLILDENITTEHYGVGFRMDDAALRDLVEYTIVEMYNDGTVETIAQKYADQGINFDAFILTSTDITEKPVVDIKKFIVGFDQDFPPYGYVDNSGAFAGFDLDMAAEVAKRNDWELKLMPINWDLKDAELASGNIDCIWNGFTIEGRESQYLFTKPYMDNTQVVVVLANSGIATFADLEGKVVMAQSNSAAFAALNDEHPDLVKTFKELRTIPEYNTAFLELDQGSVDAIAIDLPVAVFQIASHS